MSLFSEKVGETFGEVFVKGFRGSGEGEIFYFIVGGGGFQGFVRSRSSTLFRRLS